MNVTVAQEDFVLKRESAEIYADFTISRIPSKVRAEFTDVQLAAIRRALVAQDQEAQHSIDLRLRIPLYFRQYYFVFFGGRDRRKHTLTLEMHRLNRYPRVLRRSLYFIASSLIILSVLAFLFVALYLIKSFAGIDLFSDFHLSEILPVDIFGAAKNYLKDPG